MRKANAPSPTVPFPTGVSAVALDCRGHTCVIEDGGGVKCWGNNYDGQLGISRSSLDMQLSPVQVPGTMMYVHIAHRRARARHDAVQPQVRIGSS